MRENRIGPDEREQMLIEMERTGRAGPCTHYRRGHLRQLPTGVQTWVRACLVAAGKVST